MRSIESTPSSPEPDREALLNTPITIDGTTLPFKTWFLAFCRPGVALEEIPTETIAEYVDAYLSGRNPHTSSDTAA